MDFLGWGRIGAILLLALPLWGADESSVKAAFVYHFTKFVDWPAESLPGAGDSFKICIAGEKTLLEALMTASAGKKAAGRPLSVVVIQSPREAASCQVLYIDADPQKQEPMLAAVRGTGVLTVGENESFFPGGGIVRLKLDQGRIRIVINLREAERSRLRVSSRLLSLAEVIK